MKNENIIGRELEKEREDLLRMIEEQIPPDVLTRIDAINSLVEKHSEEIKIKISYKGAFDGY